MNRSLVAIALLCSAVAACDGLTPPVEPVARFDLDVEPAVVYEQEQMRVQILEDRFSLESDATARREVVERIDFTSPAERDTTITRREHYRYETDGATIELTFVCDPRALCIAGPHLWGQLTSEGMELRWFRDPEILLSYQRRNP